ncbi:U3 small nucleolar RNA-associated protein 14 homolog A [Mugil cephalus]|uniref:U3 small nucleolar RNA-associated protein 14 homolog A n=1 Tax=Mugil cephalus TaxID=48193 RepID=UPI001FB71779|nr:U3 small nucleolar RNA-associated protein 14 homolog A [Mugil cephalus]
MAKVSKKKGSKKILKTSPEVTDKSAGATVDVVYDDDEEESAFNVAEEDDNSEEDEGDAENERKRQKLLDAIGALGGKRKKTQGERSEAAVQMSEFTVNAEGEGDKIDLSDLIGTVEKTPTVPAKTKKQLQNLQRSNNTIECPLSKQESERIQRDVAFNKAATAVTRWKSAITQNQRAEQLVFPLNQEPSGPKPIESVVRGWKAQTPLEQEIFALLSANKQPINDPILTPAEEASMKAMNLGEAKIRRAELQKARALQSYYEAKARRERKIKSKKYHRVQNKAKRKEFVKQFDEMVKTDPAAALEELNKMELARMQERMSLKHQNSGKWAKSKAIMAKYDKGARDDMQKQLELNKDLTQKLVTSLNDEEEKAEEEEEGADDPEVLPDFVNDAEHGLDSSNPWMRGKLSEEMSETVGLTTEGLGAKENTAAELEEEEEEVEETEEETLLREFDSRRKLRKAQEAETATAMSVEEEDDEEDEEDIVKETITTAASDKEEEAGSEITSLLKGIAEGRVEAEAAADVGCTDTSAQLEEGLTRVRTLEDIELLAHEASASDKAPSGSQQQSTATENLPPAGPQKAGKKRKKKAGIELKQVLTKDTKEIKVPLTVTTEDSEEMDGEEKLDQRGLIKEAFAGDDVISDFLKDKKKQEDAGKPQVVDLTLPGWGEWGGIGLKPSRGKRKRFRVKAAPRPPRKDERLPSVIISEKRNSTLSLHQVNVLPFPFENHTQFESTLRCPLGRTWNTEQTVRKMTKPKVVTKVGAIIEPMTEDLLEKNKTQLSARKNSSMDSKKRKH